MIEINQKYREEMKETKSFESKQTQKIDQNQNESNKNSSSSFNVQSNEQNSIEFEIIEERDLKQQEILVKYNENCS